MDNEVKILIVDDVSMNRLLLKTLFDKEYTAFEAGDGFEALEILERENIDVIILDIIMPNMDGIELIKRIKANPQYANIPIVVATEAGTASNELKVSELGADSFITKPYNPNIIKYRVNNLVNTYILSKKEDKIAAEQSIDRLNTFMGMIDTGVCLIKKTDKYRITYCNSTLFSMLNYRSEDEKTVIGADALQFVSETSQESINEVFESALRRQSISCELDLLKREGDIVHVSVNIRIRISNQSPKLYFVTISPSTSAKDSNRLKQELHKYEMQFRRDSLTNLYNKDAFIKSTQEMLKSHSNHTFVLAQWNLDRFKAINELLGSSVGDTILKEFADYLTKTFKGLCTYGRLEADNFVTCCTRGFLERNALEIQEVINGRSSWCSINYPIQMHVGYYVIGDDENDIVKMCDRSSIALQLIKNSFIKRECFFNDEMRYNYLLEQQMMGEADMAMDKKEFYVVYQPVVDVKTKRIVSAEALVRWKKSDGTIVSPGEFIPAFEKNGYISKLDMYVWDEVCKFQNERVQAGKPIVPISVNVSRIDFYNKDLHADIEKLMEKYGLDSEYFKLEITESAYMDQPQELMGAIRSFQSAGYKVLMDDFGSGYSSLNMLKDVSADVLKIDMRFMDNVDTSERAGNILFSIIQMAKAIKMQVIAEGVETESQYNLLLNMDCDCIQGYYFYKPMVAADFSSRLDGDGIVEISEKSLNNEPAILCMVNNDDKEKMNMVLNGLTDIVFTDSLKETYEVIRRDFMDISMVILDGAGDHDEVIKLIEKIKTRLFLSSIPLVVIIPDKDDAYIEKLYAKGVLEVKPRPFDWDAFRLHAEAFFKRRLNRPAGEIKKKDKSVHAKSMEAMAENSRVGFARLLVENDDDLSIKSVELVNDKFLYIHQLIYEEATDKKKFLGIMKNIFHIDESHLLLDMKEAIDAVKDCIQHEYRIKWDNGIVHQMLLNCTFTYSKKGVYLDIIELENQSSSEYKLDKLVQGLMRQISAGINAKIWRYYPNSDLLEYYRNSKEGIYTRSVFEKGRDFLINNPMFAYEDRKRVTEMIDLMVGGAETLTGEFFISPPENSQSSYWVRIVSIRVDSTEHNGDIIMAVSCDITAEIEARERSWQEKQYWERMERGSELFGEVNLSENTILSRNIWEQLKRLGLKHKVSYSTVVDYLVETVNSNEQENLRLMLGREKLMQLYESGKENITFDFLADLYRNGKYEWYRSEMLMARNTDTNHIYTSWQIKNIKNINENNNSIIRMAQMDPLTGAYNRIMLEQTMDVFMDKSKASADSDIGALYVMDIDDFMYINDAFGHDFGDDVIKTFSKVLTKIYDGEKYIARLSGDEFAMFVPRIGSEKSAGALAEKICEKAASSAMWDGVEVSLSVSVGAYIVKAGETFKEAFPNADEALRKAKSAGKGGYKFYSCE